MSLTVLEPGLYTSVQDFGRTGRRGLGVPLGGAADRWSLAIGNALVGNPPNTPALEITMLGPTVSAGCDLACSLYGAPFQLAVSGRTAPPNRSFTLPAGATLRIGGTPTGLRAYLCVAGGLLVPRMLGSASADTSVRAGDVLDCRPGRISVRWPAEATEWDREPDILRALPGNHIGLFDADRVFGPSFTVAPQSDRMGLRLLGETLRRRPAELLSEPVCPGTLQVANDGQTILLGPACQTIGGYPKAACVITADLDKLGRLRPGQSVRFRQVGMEEAARARRAKADELRLWMARLAAAARL